MLIALELDGGDGADSCIILIINFLHHCAQCLQAEPRQDALVLPHKGVLVVARHTAERNTPAGAPPPATASCAAEVPARTAVNRTHSCPGIAGETLLEEAVELASSAGLVRPHDRIVIVQMVADTFVVKIITVDGDGDSIEPIRPKSLVDIIKVSRPSPAQQCQAWLTFVVNMVVSVTTGIVVIVTTTAAVVLPCNVIDSGGVPINALSCKQCQTSTCSHCDSRPGFVSAATNLCGIKLGLGSGLL